MNRRGLIVAFCASAGLLRAADPPAKSLPLPGETFLIEGRAAFVIPPASGREGKTPTPWVWYAPTLPGLPGGAEKWMFEQFTRAGIAIAGVDVGESYGSPEGRAQFTALYRELTEKRGFAPKPVLLGRSRGGLMALSWAAENADKVAGFAGIYPVCNLASYPGIAKAAGAYRMTAEELTARLAEHNPIDRLAGLAKAGVPLFAIHGDVDRVVPLEANSGELKKRHEALGGEMTLIIPAGQGHNMWEGFFHCQELVDFTLTRLLGKVEVIVSPGVNAVAREGITGSGTPVMADGAGGRRALLFYPNHPDDFGGSAGTGAALSENGGRTWTAGPDDWPLARAVDLWVDRLRNGDLLAFGIRWAPDPAKRGDLTARDVPPDAYRIAISRDQGRTWAEETATIDCPDELGVIARPLFHFVEDSAGALHLPAYAWSKTGNRALLLRSEDGGRRWRVRSVIATAAAIVQAGTPVTTPWLETALSPAADGTWLAVIRTGSNAGAALMMARSADAGLTWSPVEKVLAGPGSRPAAGKLPTLQLLPNGMLALLTAHSKNHCRLYVSADGSGRRWSEGWVITSQSGGNAGMTVTGPDSLLVVTPANRRIDAWTVSVRREAPAGSPGLAAPASVTVAGPRAEVAWTPPADSGQVARYRVTPVMVSPPPASPDTGMFPHAAIETPDAAMTRLELGRRLSPGATYVVRVSAVDDTGAVGPAVSSAPFLAGAP